MTLQGKLYEKLWLEYNGFLDKLRGLPPQQIIDSSYEKVAKEEILMHFEDRGNLTGEQAKMMLDQDIGLDTLYEVLMDSSVGTDTAIIECIDGYIEYRVDELTHDERLYKAEIQLPDQKDLHLEVFGAEDDASAVKHAYELLDEWEGATLAEVHELNENYDSIREIDLQKYTNLTPKPQTFAERLQEAQAKADKINAQNAQNKGQTPIVSNAKNNEEIGE